MDDPKSSFAPIGAPRYPFYVPDQVASSAPQCITRVEFITQSRRLADAEALGRVADLHYLVGSFPMSPASEGVKGQDGRAAQMITDMERWQALMPDELKRFGREWLKRSRSDDRSEPGFDGSKMWFDQGWCKHLMKKRITIRDGSWASLPEPRRYRIRICPEAAVAEKLACGDNLPAFMRELMRRIENDLGAYFPEKTRPLIWIGAGHYRPEMPASLLDPLDETSDDPFSPEALALWEAKPKCHAHFAVRGVDTAGRVLWFERSYVHSAKPGVRGSGLENRARGLLQEFFDGAGYAKAS